MADEYPQSHITLFRSGGYWLITAGMTLAKFPPSNGGRFWTPGACAVTLSKTILSASNICPKAPCTGCGINFYIKKHLKHTGSGI